MYVFHRKDVGSFSVQNCNNFDKKKFIFFVLFLEEEFPAPPPPEDLAKLSFEAQFKVMKYFLDVGGGG